MKDKKEWTQARLNAFVKGALRQAYYRFPEKYKAKNAAYVGTEINPKTGRMAKHYLCACCNKKFVSADVEVDHIEPIVPFSGFTSWDSVIENMFCSADNLQILCKGCHKEKTKKEREERKKYKKEDL